MRMKREVVMAAVWTEGVARDVVEENEKRTSFTRTCGTSISYSLLSWYLSSVRVRRSVMMCDV